MRILFDLNPDESRVRQICLADRHFAWLVDRIGSLEIPSRVNAFESLTRSLIGQQLSVKAAGTICGRVEEKCGVITPDSILAVSEEELRSAGVSRAKIGYIQGLADLVKREEFDLDFPVSAGNEEVINTLSKAKGIGRWTAEMFLIFCLGREDVLSLGDAGLRRAAGWLYGRSDSDILEVSGEIWKPYRTIVSLYLWEAVNRGLLNERKSI
jgi:DNA-3-methyladenine glycosylase II